MKTINKTPAPNDLTNFADDHPDASWEPDFRHHQGGMAYATLRELILKDQGHLCAYCEILLKEKPPHKIRIEHFHSKSDNSDPKKNWSLDWNNVIGVCIGGEDTKEAHPLPENLSCDAHKNHCINKRLFDESVDGCLLNPLHIPTSPPLFSLNRATGELVPNDSACAKATINGNAFASTKELVENTIRVLNLNCDRLNQQRFLVLNQYNRKIAMARKESDKQIHSKLAKRWFRAQWPSFFSTRRALLGKHAEKELEHIGFAG